MRILMFGRGVIATIYGRILHAAGHDVEFYVRPGRAAEYGDEVQLDWIDGRRRPFGRRVRESFPTLLRESLAPDDGFDLIMLSVGHHQLAEAAAFLAPRIGDATVLVAGNLWAEPLDAVAPLPPDQLVFGFPLAGGGFDDDGVLQGGLLPSVVIGVTGASPTRREQAVITALRQAGLAVRQEADMRGWLWLHFIADAGMFTQAMRSGSLADMIGDRRAFRDAFLTPANCCPSSRLGGSISVGTAPPCCRTASPGWSPLRQDGRPRCSHLPKGASRLTPTPTPRRCAPCSRTRGAKLTG